MVQVLVPTTRYWMLYLNAPLTVPQVTRALVEVMLVTENPTGVPQITPPDVVNVADEVNALVEPGQTVCT